ncbi:hypothetical protein LO772_00675 [Yinghuangia sp. ASG 101]|uniref:hypothetical protein n=1 Tax=Yinghuangia sp. ASG 101 TaxID=2896848 RepID=UPI001E470A27|nr:hypothetical protein [Yinghuangia sp. ASG 101]UGQ12158.1 hypothetical protein LO772_00675 [Yinghuangia sp. ASG 101]
MDLRGRSVVLFGEFRSIGTAEAVRRLKSLGAHVADSVTRETDVMFLATGERGPIPRTEDMLRTPQFDEEALLGMLERAVGAPPSGGEPPSFLPRTPAPADPVDAEALCALVEEADWSAFVPDRDLAALRTRLADLERRQGVTEAHRSATRRLCATGETSLWHPFGHDAEIVGHAMSPDGRHLATGSWYPDGDYDAGGVLQIWDVASGRCVNTIRDVDGGVGWPDYAGTIQWSADGSRLAVAYATNIVGLWNPAGDDDEPVATINVSDGNSRPSSFALSPDGHSVYHHCTTNGDGGLQGCIVPLDRGGLFWLPNRVQADHPYTMARQLPAGVREAIRQAEIADNVGEWIENPVWSPDGTRLFGTNAICVDARTRTVLWYTPATTAAPSPDGHRVAAATRDGLFFLDAADGHVQDGPFDLGTVCSLHWAPGRPDRLAVAVARSGTSAPAVHIFDAGRHVGSVAVPHPQWQAGERWTGDRNAWSWAPDGERAACLTDTGTVEVWSFTDPAHPERLRTLPAEATCAVRWGADDTIVLPAERRVRFVRAETGGLVGDFAFLRAPEGPRPVEGYDAYEFERQFFPLDDHTWAMTLEPDVVVAPPDREDALDAVLTWSVGRRHAWPVRWGDLSVRPDVPTADVDPGAGTSLGDRPS